MPFREPVVCGAKAEKACVSPLPPPWLHPSERPAICEVQGDMRPGCLTGRRAGNSPRAPNQRPLPGEFGAKLEAMLGALWGPGPVSCFHHSVPM